MSAIELQWRRQTLRLRHRWATSQGGIDEKQTIVVEVRHDGLTGRGEATPSALYGQSFESTEAALGEMRPLLGNDPFALQEITERLIDHCDGQRAAIAAVENALYDLVGRKLKLPVWRLLGLPEPRVKTTFSIGIADVNEVKLKTREALDAGYDRLKVKVGGDHDEATLGAIRDVFDGPLLLDANQAWSPDAASHRIRALAPFRPTLIEQPLPVAAWEYFKPLRELGVAPIFADESCERPQDVLRLNGYVDGVNIKFNKCGGIREALKMVTLARALGLQIMLGCFVCSSLAIAPALAIATQVDFVDLDGALLLAEDPFSGLARWENGLLCAARGPGFGLAE